MSQGTILARPVLSGDGGATRQFGLCGDGGGSGHFGLRGDRFGRNGLSTESYDTTVPPACVVGAFGQLGSVMSAFGQQNPGKARKALVESAQNGRRLAGSAHNACGLRQTGYSAPRKAVNRTPSLSPQTPLWCLAPPSPERPEQKTRRPALHRPPLAWYAALGSRTRNGCRSGPYLGTSG